MFSQQFRMCPQRIRRKAILVSDILKDHAVLFEMAFRKKSAARGALRANTEVRFGAALIGKRAAAQKERVKIPVSGKTIFVEARNLRVAKDWFAEDKA